MAFERDPNALSTMLRGQTQFSRYTPEEEQLNSMIPEEQLYQAQEAQADAGRAHGGPYAVSSREQLRGSGMAELRKLFGINQAQAHAKAYPNQVTGEYNLARERERSSGNVAAARAKAEADAANQGASQRFQEANQGRQNTFQAGENAAGRNAVASQGALNRSGRMDVAREATGRAASNQAAISERAHPSGGAMNYLKSFFEAKPAAAVAAPAGGGVSATAAVDALRQHPETSNMTFQQLVDSGELEGATPDEILQFQQLWGG